MRPGYFQRDEAAYSAAFTSIDSCLSRAERQLLGDVEYSDCLGVESERQEIASRLWQAFVLGEQIALLLEE